MVARLSAMVAGPSAMVAGPSAMTAGPSAMVAGLSAMVAGLETVWRAHAQGPAASFPLENDGRPLAARRNPLARPAGMAAALPLFFSRDGAPDPAHQVPRTRGVDRVCQGESAPP